SKAEDCFFCCTCLVVVEIICVYRTRAILKLLIKARSSLWLPRVVAHATPNPSPNSQLYHVTPLLDEDRDGCGAHCCSSAGALPLTEREHKTRSALRHRGWLGHSRRAGGFPAAPQVRGKTPAPPPPQPPAAGLTLPCLLGEFLLGFRSWSFPSLPQNGRKGEALGGA
ncbi:hypothetical protein DV515_00005833, partial [Chloebia gouldiae]